MRHNYQGFVQYLKPLSESWMREMLPFNIPYIQLRKNLYEDTMDNGNHYKNQKNQECQILLPLTSQGDQGSIYFRPGLKHDENAAVVSCHSLDCRLEHSSLVWVIFIL